MTQSEQAPTKILDSQTRSSLLERSSKRRRRNGRSRPKQMPTANFDFLSTADFDTDRDKSRKKGAFNVLRLLVEREVGHAGLPARWQERMLLRSESTGHRAKTTPEWKEFAKRDIPFRALQTPITSAILGIDQSASYMVAMEGVEDMQSGQRQLCLQFYGLPSESALQKRTCRRERRRIPVSPVLLSVPLGSDFGVDNTIDFSALPAVLPMFCRLFANMGLAVTVAPSGVTVTIFSSPSSNSQAVFAPMTLKWVNIDSGCMKTLFFRVYEASVLLRIGGEKRPKFVEATSRVVLLSAGPSYRMIWIRLASVEKDGLDYPIPAPTSIEDWISLPELIEYKPIESWKPTHESQLKVTADIDVHLGKLVRHVLSVHPLASLCRQENARTHFVTIRRGSAHMEVCLELPSKVEGIAVFGFVEINHLQSSYRYLKWIVHPTTKMPLAQCRTQLLQLRLHCLYENCWNFLKPCELDGLDEYWSLADWAENPAIVSPVGPCNECFDNRNVIEQKPVASFCSSKFPVSIRYFDPTTETL